MLQTETIYLSGVPMISHKLVATTLNAFLFFSSRFHYALF